MVEKDFLSKAKFSKMVEKEAFAKNMSYMDSILYNCEKNNIEPEDSKKFLSSVIQEKLEAEAMNLNYIPRQNTLPFD